jgi:hypothetical protein
MLMFHEKRKYLVSRRDKSCFVTNNWFFQKVHWIWCHQNAQVFDWQHIWWTCFPKDSLHSYGYGYQCNCVHLLHLYSTRQIDRAGTSQEKLKEASPILNFTFCNIDVLSLNILSLVILLVASIPLTLKWISQIQFGLFPACPTSQNGQWGPVENETLWENWNNLFCHCELSICL